MVLKDIRVGLGITGSFCNFDKLAPVIKKLQKEGATIIPIFSYSVQEETNRFSNPIKIEEDIENLTKNNLIKTISEAEPIGPKNMIDIMLILPCTGNTVAKLANGITDTPVLMATKSHLRNNKAVVIALSTNDALSGNAENIGRILNRKNYFFVPFKQDDPFKKPFSLGFDKNKVIDTIIMAMNKEQFQPILT